VVSLVLLGSLALSSVAYAKWTDSVTINATVATYTQNDTLAYTYPCSTGLTCDLLYSYIPQNPDQLPKPFNDLHLILHQATPGAGYICDYSIHNGGTVPMKVQSIQIINNNGPKFTVALSGDISVGKVIDPGVTVVGVATITFNGSATDTYDRVFDVQFVDVAWNVP
jgi:hypothetical protein